MKILPNLISALRIAGALCLLCTVPLSAGFFLIYTLCGLSDILDGLLARRLDAASVRGARLDSLADLLFCAAALLKLLPVLRSRLPVTLWQAAAMVLLLRLSACAVSIRKGRGFTGVHTWGNKLAGAALFAMAYLLGLPAFVPLCWVLWGIALLSGVEELLIQLFRRDFHPDLKTFLDHKQEMEP